MGRQALQQAAAQARRDQMRIKQKMKELEHGPAEPLEAAFESSPTAEGDVCRNDRRDRLAQREEAEAKHRQALQAAAAQARRDQLQMKQKMRDLQDRPNGNEALGDVVAEDVCAPS